MNHASCQRDYYTLVTDFVIIRFSRSRLVWEVFEVTVSDCVIHFKSSAHAECCYRADLKNLNRKQNSTEGLFSNVVGFNSCHFDNGYLEN